MPEVRAALRALGPDVQSCTDSEIPLPGRGLHRRLRLRVWLLPTGRWTLEVPELERRNQSSTPYAQRRAMIQIYGCLHLAVARRVGRFTRPFRSTRRQKVERAFRVTVPGPPPTSAALVRRVRGRRAQLIACVPGASRPRPNHELVVRATLGADGSITLQGLAVPASVPFDVAARCVAAELAGLDNPRVTAERAFEAVVPFHFDEPTEADPSEL